MKSLMNNTIKCFTETINDMVDKIHLLINIISSVENWEMFGGTELETEGMHSNQGKFIYPHLSFKSNSVLKYEY